MSFQIDTAFVKQYHDNVEFLLQQKPSRLRAAVRVEEQTGEESFWEQVGVQSMQEVSVRFGDSPQTDTPHARRRVTLRQFDNGDFIDNFDKVKLLIDPSSSYVQAFTYAANRKIDDIILGRTAEPGVDDTTVLGGFFDVAYTGKAGTTTVAFPSANQVAVDFSTTGTNSNLTINKLIEARRLMLSYENDPELESWYIAYHASQLASLLKTTQVTSADYNTVKALVRGEMDTFLGYQFLHTERALKNGSGYRRIPVWAKSGLLLSIGKDITTRVSERPDKKFSWYAYICMSMGSVRMQENKVIELICDETK